MAIPFSRRAAPGVTPIWHALCQLTDKGTPIPNVYNACVALRGDPAWTGKLRFDAMRRTPLLSDAPIEDPDLFRIHFWLQEHGLRRIGLDPVREAVVLISHEHSFHPVRDWLDGLVWDRVGRLDSWLADYLGADPVSPTSQFGRWFLISMVARIYRPGCQVDHMLVLEGPQGILKSQACRALGGSFFSDGLPDLTSDYVRVSMHLRGKWLIEVAELSAFSRAESTKLKSFLTQQAEDFTPKFGHHESHEPRQCVFIGTTNKDTYLRDETGGRRFWPVKCGEIDLPGLLAARDQLFAEAVSLLHDGERWYPDHDFWSDHIKPLQEQRYLGDSWETQIADWDFMDAERDSNGRAVYQSNGTGTHEPAPRIPVKGPPYALIDIARGALHLDRLSKAEEMRLASTLDSLGWTRGKRSNRGVPWLPPAAPQPPPVQQINPTLGF